MDSDKTDYRDDMTLAEMGLNDGEMQKDAIKNADRVYFVSHEMAKSFRVRCLKSALDRLGAAFTHRTDPKFVDKILNRQKVVVENREAHYQGSDAWKNGLYVYKRGELVNFISVVVEGKPDGALIWNAGRDNAKFSVITNVKR